jgi:alpha-mannosidase
MIRLKRKLYQQRIDVFLKRLQQLFYPEEVPMEAEYRRFDGIEAFEQRTAGQFQPISRGMPWGKDWQRAWFHMKGTVPAAWKNKTVAVRINLGGEALIFDKNGVPRYGLSVHSLWAGHDFRRDRYIITSPADGGENVELWLEASAGQLFGLQLHVDKGDQVPKQFGKYEAKLNETVLAVFRQDIWHLYLDFRVLNEQMHALPENSVRRLRILHTLNRAIDGFNGSEFNVCKTRQILQELLHQKNTASDLSTAAIGHAHLDTAWLWPVDESIRKCARTFANQLDLMDRYPGYKFGASQAQHYAFVKQYYPGLYSRIKEKVKQGRWEIQGGMWVEADNNLIGGESMVRQILHGKNFFKEEFGIDINNHWLPDVFGYSAALPQIMKKSGLDYFVTQKLSWNQFNRLPHHTFRWRGIDGTEVITHFPPEDDYNSELLPSKLMEARDNFTENYYLDEFLTLFGIGNGGGGPTEEIIETGLRLKNMEGVPGVKFTFAQEFLERLEDKRNQLPVWVGELYMEGHRGTYTTHAENKKMNRRMEHYLRELEILYASLPLTEYPSAELDAMWKTLLLNQFHDIIPGTSITPVYHETHRQYTELLTRYTRLKEHALRQMLEPRNNSVSLINTLSYTYTRPVKLPPHWSGYEIVTQQGTEVHQQQENGCPIIQLSIPPLSVVTLIKGKTKTQPPPSSFQKSLVLENELICYEFSERGTISRIFDRENQREVLPAGTEGNQIILYEDRPADWDAWDIDIYYENQHLQQARLETYETVANGPVRQGIEFHYTIGNSSISQNVYLDAHSKRLDFKTCVNWNEDHKLLRVSFPLNVRSDTATYEIQYGHVKRSTHRNTGWEMAKFEAVGHRYADLSDRDYGAALLNDSKYGYKIHENEISLSLLRAPTMPDPHADRGRHTFTYCFLPHSGELIDSAVLSEAAQLNQPVICADGTNGQNTRFPVSMDTEDIVMEVIKKAEKESALILRLYEPRGKEATANLTIANAEVLDAFESDLMENNQSKPTLKQGILTLHVTPFEIKTIKLTTK